MLFHLTVSDKGVVSLWDSQEKAQLGCQAFEQYVELELTEVQRLTIFEAKMRARVEKLEAKLRNRA